MENILEMETEYPVEEKRAYRKYFFEKQLFDIMRNSGNWK